MSELIRTGPSINKGRSKQDYSTPWSFIKAVENRFGKLDFDLAACYENKKAARFYAAESLEQDWTKLEGNLWLNPPFGVIGPWAKKCADTANNFTAFTGKILLLTPASVGSNWFADYVDNRARVYFLRPRLTFEGADDPFPKDLVLSVYGMGFLKTGYECWRWDTP